MTTPWKATASVSSITEVEKRYLEKLLDMGGGYVLDFTDATFDALFRRHGMAIHSNKYQTYGTSKAKKLRAFWEKEADARVGNVLSELLDTYKVQCELNGLDSDYILLERCRAAVARLSGKKPNTNTNTVEGFLARDFDTPNFQKLPIESPVAMIIEQRFKEARVVLAANAPLSVIFLCGSLLEAVLLGAALRDPKRFTRSQISPKKRDGKATPVNEWSLAQMIDVACDVDLLEPDVKIFSHGLRDFRNYIHPYQQVGSGFSPDMHTARVCFQVLKAALASVAGERR